MAAYSECQVNSLPLCRRAQVFRAERRLHHATRQYVTTDHVEERWEIHTKLTFPPVPSLLLRSISCVRPEAISHVDITQSRDLPEYVFSGATPTLDQ
jgi:hypothetical protein